MPTDWSQKQNRSYFVWELGKVPEVCIAIFSHRKGNQLNPKKNDYAQIGIAYYVVFEPLQQIQREDELTGKLLKVWALRRFLRKNVPSWQGRFSRDITAASIN